MGAVRYRFTIEECRKMGKAGVFHEDDRVELVDGEVVEMAAIGDGDKLTWQRCSQVVRG